MDTRDLMESIVNRNTVNESTSSLNVNKLAEDVKDTVKQFLSSKFDPLYNNIDSYYKVKVREPYGDSSDADVIEVTLTKQYFNEFNNSVIENITDTLNELLEKKYNAKYVFFETESDKKTLAYIWK